MASKINGRDPINSNRESIKIRKPIQIDYCTDWNINLFSIDGITRMINVSLLSLDELRAFLAVLEYSPPLYLEEITSQFEEKAMEILKMKLPIVVNTKRCLSESLIYEMGEVPHSILYVPVVFLNDYVRGMLDPLASNLSDLRHNIAYAKSRKIMTILELQYLPAINNWIDNYEIIDMLQNYISHVIIRFTRISESFLMALGTSEVLNKSKLQKYYNYQPISGFYSIVEPEKDKFLLELKEYLAGKKITMDVLKELFRNVSVNRHVPTGLSKNTFGIDSFFFRKSDNNFIEEKSFERQNCLTCGKPIF